MSSNFGDFQMRVYADAVKGVNSRYTPGYYDPVLVPLSSCYPEWR